MTFDEYAAFVGSPENLGREGFDRIQCFQPAHAVAVVDIEKLVGEK